MQVPARYVQLGYNVLGLVEARVVSMTASQANWMGRLLY